MTCYLNTYANINKHYPCDAFRFWLASWSRGWCREWAVIDIHFIWWPNGETHHSDLYMQYNTIRHYRHTFSSVFLHVSGHFEHFFCEKNLLWGPYYFDKEPLLEQYTCDMTRSQLFCNLTDVTCSPRSAVILCLLVSSESQNGGNGRACACAICGWRQCRNIEQLIGPS